MRFDPHILDAIRARLPVSQLIGRTLALKKQGREYAALSPFNSEKTPSFFVNDDKQFYHCFSSGKHGDIFRWLMDTEGLSFPEAVERLAAEAGVALPEDTPDAARRRERAKSLHDWMEAANTHFQEALRGNAGAEARRYLEGRGFPAADWAQFEIGFAPAQRDGLKRHLLGRGAPVHALIEAGLLIEPDSGEPYDRFRDRVMFPIRDAQGKLAGFGGRALSKEARAKYLNSPETVLFDKGRMLYRYRDARAALAKDKGLIAKDGPPTPPGLLVAEGYMDVIALARAGFSAAVAPLGTAVTEHQLELLWRAGPEPVFCFDGDGAGQRAAARAAERALPLLKPGFSIRFALMPAGQDPDDLIRAAGPGAMAEVIAQAKTLDEIVWTTAREAAPADTPERRAGLRQRLVDAAAAIADEGVRGEFRRALLDRYYEAFRRKPQERGRQDPRRGAPSEPRPETKTRIGQREQARQATDMGRLLAAFFTYPAILSDCAEALASAPTATAEQEQLKNLLLEAAFSSEVVDKSLLDGHVARSGSVQAVAGLVSNPLLAVAPVVSSQMSHEDACEAWLQAADDYDRRFSRHEEQDELIRELKAARAAGDRDRMTTIAKRIRTVSAKA